MADVLWYTTSCADGCESTNADPESGKGTTEEDFVWRIVHFAGGIEQDGIFEQKTRKHLIWSSLWVWHRRGRMAMMTAESNL